MLVDINDKDTELFIKMIGSLSISIISASRGVEDWTRTLDPDKKSEPSYVKDSQFFSVNELFY